MTLSYYFLRAYASFRTTTFRRSAKLSTVRLHLLIEEVADTHFKRIRDLM